MLKTKVKESKSLIYLFLSFAIPFFILVLCLISTQSTPFGNNSLLIRDAKNQYIDFLSYMTSIYRGENDLLYSFSKGMGGDFLSLAAYYLLSPFNIIFVLASYSTMPLFFDLAVILKLAFCGISFYYCSSRIFGNKTEFIAFSSVYALNGYNIVYHWNIMWLDGVIILPIVCLGIYRIWKEEKYTLYIVSLIYALISNYYIGYMICIASVLMSCAMFIIKDSTSLKSKTITFSKYTLASLISGFFCAFIWLPSFLTLKDSRAKLDFASYSFDIIFSFTEFLSKLITGAISNRQLEGQFPNIFCSIAIVFIVILFFSSKEIDIRKKISALLVLSLILLGMFITGFNTVWHGFSSTNSFNFRYSFIFSFVLIFIAQYYWVEKKEISKKQILCSGLIMLILFVLIKIKAFEHISNIGLLISLFVFITVFLSLQPWRKIPSSTKTLILIFVLIFDIAANAVICFKNINLNNGTLGVEEHIYSAYLSDTLHEKIKSEDDGFYRSEVIFRRGLNDPMYYQYNGLTHFSSGDKKSVMEYVEKMGLRYNKYWTSFVSGSTNEAESLLGLKYILGGEDISQYKNYDVLFIEDGQAVYKNKNCLPMAYIASKNIKNVSMENKDYFALHNEIWSGITGEPQSILKQETNFKIKLNNLKQSYDSEGNTIYKKIREDAAASVIYEIEISENKPLYYYFTAPLVQMANVYINGEDDGQYFWIYRWNMISAGTFEPGEKISIEIVLKENDLTVSSQYFYYEDLAALELASNKILENPSEIIKIKSSHLKGNISCDEDSVVIFNMPFDKGWTLKIDGKETDTFNVMDAILAADISKGEHSFELKYIPAGLKEGLCLSAISLIAAFLWYLKEKKK